MKNGPSSSEQKTGSRGRSASGSPISRTALNQHRVQAKPLTRNSPCEAVAELALVFDVELAAEERGDVVGLDGVDRRPGQVAVDRREIRLLRNTMSVAYSHWSTLQ